MGALVGGGLDGVLLILHGAMVIASYPDGEGEVLRRVRGHLRECLGEAGKLVPIAADLDLHANTSDAMAANASVLTAYRKNPHTDAREAGSRAAQFLNRLMDSGEATQIVRVAPPVIYAPRGTGTDTEPMITLQAAARRLEAEHPELLEVCPGRLRLRRHRLRRRQFPGHDDGGGKRCPRPAGSAGR